jgi:hypothetical protein
VPASFFNMVKQTVSAVASGGTGALTLATAEAGYISLATAGAVDGDVFDYAIQEAAKFEVGRGTYSTTGPTLTRTTVHISSAGAGVAETFSTTGVNTKLIGVTAAETMRAIDPRGKHVLPLPYTAFQKLQTGGPGVQALADTATNKNPLGGHAFDAASVERAIARIPLPKSVDRSQGYRYRVRWYHPAATTNFGVVWGSRAVARGDNEALDAAFGTEVNVTDVGGVTERQYISAWSTMVTPAGSWAEDDTLDVEISRLATSGSDNLAQDAIMYYVDLEFITLAGTDA